VEAPVNRARLGAAVAAFAGQLAIAARTHDVPDAGALAGEALAWLVVGLLPLPRDWRGSAAWPAVLLLAAAALRHDPGLLAAMGIATVAVVAVRVLDDLVGSRGLAAALAALVAAGVARTGQLLAAGVGIEPLRREWALTQDLAPAPGRPVLLITVDTLRWDDAGPVLAPVRDEAACWPRAMSTSSWTVPALASLHTGRTPAEHGAAVVLPGPRPTAVRPHVPMLAETLGGAGWPTATFTENILTSGSLGFARGMDVFHHADEDLPPAFAFVGAVPPRSPAERAARWLVDAPPGFLWVHLADPHLPYPAWPDDPADPLVTAVAGRWDLLAPGPVRAGMLALPGAARGSLRTLYRAQVDRTAQRVARTVADARGRWPEAIVVLTADHGEEFWDHGGFEHGHSHHGEVVDVPLCIAGPGMAPGTRTDLASLVDVAPTVLAMLGLPHQGVDLRQPVPPDRIATADGALYFGPAGSARQGTRRAIVGVGEYDLAADPGELVVLPPGALTDAARGAMATPGEDAPVDLSMEALRRLGYVE